jgi:hypothetical protein
MSDPMAAALAGGALAGAVVLTGVILTELLTRSRERLRRIENSSHQLLEAIGPLQQELRKPWRDAALAPGTPFMEAAARFQAAAFELRFLTQGRRRYRAIETAVNEVIAREGAAFRRYTYQTPMTELETLGGRAITGAVFPKGSDLSDRIFELTENGLPTIVDDAE